MTTAKPSPDPMPPAHNQREAAASDNTLQRYTAMNQVPENSDILREAIQEPGDIHEQIAPLAYQLYLDRGREDGHADEDWFVQKSRSRRDIELRPGRFEGLSFSGSSN